MSAAPFDPIAERIMREWEERREQRRKEFDRLFAEWLTNRASIATPEGLSDDDFRKLTDRDDELARLITTFPAVYPWMIFHKIEVLEHYHRGGDEGTTWEDNREIVMLAGIKADLLRFELTEKTS